MHQLLAARHECSRTDRSAAIDAFDCVPDREAVARRSTSSVPCSSWCDRCARLEAAEVCWPLRLKVRFPHLFPLLSTNRVLVGHASECRKTPFYFSTHRVHGHPHIASK